MKSFSGEASLDNLEDFLNASYHINQQIPYKNLEVHHYIIGEHEVDYGVFLIVNRAIGNLSVKETA